MLTNLLVTVYLIVHFFFLSFSENVQEEGWENLRVTLEQEEEVRYLDIFLVIEI